MNPVRFSHLRAYGRSAAHGQHARSAQEDDATREMERGTAVHAILFGNRKVIPYPGAVRRGKEYEKFALENPDCEILTRNEYDKAFRMADAVQSCSLATPYLKGVLETTITFRWMGLDCRSTPDVNGDAHLTELKTSKSAEPYKFTWHAKRFAYHAQMRMEQIAAGKNKPCFIVCVESEAPYPVTVFEIDPKALQLGEKLLVSWAERLKNCEASGFFPPYSQTVYPLIIEEDEFGYEVGEDAEEEQPA